MQYSVPQFTDVEDKIIANLTLKQFGILFGAGVVVFLGYSSSKSLLVAIFLGVLFGVPALTVAFGKINGRPLYHTFPIVINHFTRPKFFIFKKESASGVKAKKVKVLQAPKEENKISAEAQRTKLHELQLQLEQSVLGKEELFKMKETQSKPKLRDKISNI